METEFKPNYAIHPGIILDDDLKSLKMKQAELSKRTGISKTIINEIIKGKRGINADIAISLESILSEPAEFWMTLQAKYEETLARLKSNDKMSDDSLNITKEKQHDKSLNNEYKATDIAQWFINRAYYDVANDNGGEYLTHLKLQKLLYYAQGCYCCMKTKPLFEEKILCWTHGPVVNEVYQVYKKYGDKTIECRKDLEIDEITEKVLEEVYNNFGQYSALKLRKMTHEEAPWKETEINKEIPLESINEYFSKKCKVL